MGKRLLRETFFFPETIPGGFEMAFHFTKHIGHPGASSVSVDDSLLNEGGFSFRKMLKLVARARRKQKAQIKLVKRMRIKPDGGWGELHPVTETVEVDGETVSRADLSEPAYGESPREAICEIPLKKADSARVLWIRPDHEDDELRGELDPWQFSKG